ncbi:MAG: 30S ribosomal protein S6 [Candidatus Glassbacteria bacterium]
MVEERMYEMVLIFDTGLEDEKVEDRLTKLQTRISEGGGQMEDVTRWGKRRLAYPIKKKESGNYVVFTFRTGTDQLEELERGLKLDEQVLRYLIVQKERRS